MFYYRIAAWQFMKSAWRSPRRKSALIAVLRVDLRPTKGTWLNGKKTNTLILRRLTPAPLLASETHVVKNKGYITQYFEKHMCNTNQLKSAEPCTLSKKHVTDYNLFN